MKIDNFWLDKRELKVNFIFLKTQCLKRKLSDYYFNEFTSTSFLIKLLGVLYDF